MACPRAPCLGEWPGSSRGQGESVPPHTATGSSPRMWPVLLGKAGCRRPLVPVLPCSSSSPLSTAEASWTLVLTGQQDVTPAKGTASMRAGPGRLSKADSRGPSRQEEAPSWPRGDRSSRHPPHCVTTDSPTSQTWSRHPLPSFPLPVGRNAPSLPLAVPGGLPGGGVNLQGQGRCVFMWAAGPGGEVKTSWRGS